MTTKRTNGPCTCGSTPRRTEDGRTVLEHCPYCPALYPAQQEPDALTRLVRLIRESDAHPTDIAEAIDLISEAREEKKKAVATATNEALDRASKVARAAAEHGCNPYAACTCNWESKLDGVEDSILYLKDRKP
jgi:hypothetical protein